MNPETQYPELKTMLESEMFIERAWIVRGGKVIKLPPPCKIIPKSQRNSFAKQLRESFDADEIYLTTISK